MSQRRYMWYLRTKNGVVHGFYICGNKYDNPFDVIKSFHAGIFWSIDACGRDELFELYDTDPSDDSFVLIPKASVEKTWVEEVS